MRKTERKKIIALAKNVLFDRRNGNIAKEQKHLDGLQAYLDKNKIDMFAADAVEQTREHLSQTSVAAIMNGLV